MKKPLPIFLLAAAAVAASAAALMACQVPVFRYALERWSADKYQVIVLSSGPLDATSQSSLKRLQTAEADRGANFEVVTADVAAIRDERMLAMWKQHQPNGLPLMIVLYPHSSEQVPDRVIEAGAFTSDAVDRMLHSPVRKEVAQRLGSGQSAVWIFVPCGDADKDSLAIRTLEQRLAAGQQKLTVPTAEELDIDPLRLEKNQIPLRIEFSIVTLDRQDPQEAFLLAALTRSEPDLSQTEPQAFPVFGRGRVLYALVGRGIKPATIDMACTFMAGPCSCQVKNMNPGFDLLLFHNWDDVVAGSMISDALPDGSSEPFLLTIPPGR
ncbi:hypothetical protein [Novipirellula artificiosorum]|uniref:Uncharacterized protein n=1 Tax=Novipirellula artificiosorum TaxID=2528016 RepID=A0A5C6DCE9_9BACT|nr:hypothetical protein [Novipirellula artificiosorum]TWU33915.1 hypothetical protein Poly41_49150 [Novipirellula artificiosorum]